MVDVLSQHRDIFPVPNVIPDCLDDDLESLALRTSAMKSEKNRLESFAHWPLWSSQRPTDLAKAGLYYTGIADRVQCAFCHGVLKKWQPGDIPMCEHRRHFPHCGFVLGGSVGNIPLENEVWTAVTITPGAGHASVDYTNEEMRLASFSRWPRHLAQTPSVLARAGFYSIQSDDKPDRVKCAYCQGKLHNWTVGDDPWMEHAKCFPHCPYIKLCMGEDFVRDLKSTNMSHCSEVTKDKSPMTSASHDDVAVAMASPQVQAVIEMGFKPDTVQKLIENKVRSGHSHIPSVQDLAISLLETNGAGNRAENSQSEEATGMEQNSRNDLKSTPQGSSEQGGSAGVQSEHCEHGEHVEHGPIPFTQENVDLVTSIRDENSRLKGQYLCKICMENQVRVTFMPCGHLACCGPCSMAVKDCPICRAPITGCVRTYF